MLVKKKPCKIIKLAKSGKIIFKGNYSELCNFINSREFQEIKTEANKTDDYIMIEDIKNVD